MLVIYWPPKNWRYNFDPKKYIGVISTKKKELTPTKKSLIKDQVIGEDQVT